MSSIPPHIPIKSPIKSSSLPAYLTPKKSSDKNHSASFSGHSVTQQKPVTKQIPPAQEQKTSGAKKLLKKMADFLSIKPSNPSYKYHSSVSTGAQTTHIWSNTPMLNVWTSNPNSVMNSNVPQTNFTHFQPIPHKGNLSQMMVPGLGVLQLNQPLFSKPLFYQQMSFSQPPAGYFPAQPQAKPPTVYQHIYQDLAEKNKVVQARVTERFNIAPKETDLLDKSVLLEKQRLSTLPQGIQSTVSRLKSRHLDQVSTSIKNHQLNLAQPLPTKPDDIEAQGKTFIHNIENGMRAIDVILDTGRAYYHPESLSKLKTIRQELNAERSLVLQVMEQKGAKGLGDKLNWQTATDFMRVGYDLTPGMLQHMSSFDDSALKSAHPFGKGMTHTVSKLIYHDGDKTTAKIFKAEDARDSSGYARITKKGSYLDTERPHFAMRNLAAQSLQSLLGLDMVPKMELATHQGKVGLLMDEAKGKTAFPPGQNDGITKKLEQNPQFANAVARELVNAELFDGLCGQQDRHPGNYLIDPDTGKVSLIDNDQSFYPGHTSVAKSTTKTSEGTWFSPWPGLPALIDQQAFDKLQGIKEQDIREKLSSLLNQDEIESTVKRLDELKQHALELKKENRVVDNWATWKSDTSPALGAAEYIKQHGSRQSYFNALERVIGNPSSSIPPVREPVREPVRKQSQPTFSSLR